MKTTTEESAPTVSSTPGVDLADRVPAMLKAVGSPLRFFGLVAILCLPVFSIAAATVRDQMAYDAFIYTLHTYLAVVGIFALIALFSPRSLYHPREIQELQSTPFFPKHRPVMPCLIALVALAMYLTYQAYVVYNVAGTRTGKPPGETNAPVQFPTGQ